MAQTGYTPILIYSSSTASNTPSAANLTNSTLGSELAINITDGKLFYKDNGGSVQVIAWKVTPTTAGGTGLTSYTAGDTLYYASGTALSKLTIGSSGYYMSSSGTAPQWSAPAALTKTDDTNVTLTLGGSASTALLNAASLTLGWSGQLATGRGGTGLGSYTAGDMLYYASGTALSKLSIGTANYVMTSSGSAPQWTAQSGLSVGTALNHLSNSTTGVMQITGPSAATTRVMTIPDANFTVARTDAGQTFTGNQTITGTLDVNGSTVVLGGTQNNGSVRIDGQSTDVLLGARYIGSAANLHLRASSASSYYDCLVLYGATGNVEFSSGNLVQATAAKGINFTANTAAAGMTSQLLNWYEEGTWTPTDGSGAGLTFSSASGWYVRKGREVTLVFSVTYPVTVNANAAKLGGVPFSSSTGNLASGGYITYTSYVGTISLLSATTTMNFYNGNSTQLTNANLSAKDIRGVIVYMV